MLYKTILLSIFFALDTVLSVGVRVGAYILVEQKLIMLFMYQIVSLKNNMGNGVETEGDIEVKRCRQLHED